MHPQQESPSSLSTGWDDATRAIDAALDRLHFLAVAIRKASAKTLEQTVGTFLTDDDIVFRRDAAILLRRRFPAARTALCQQLCDSIAVRRRILLQSNRHAKRLAIRRVAETETLDSQLSPKWQTPPPRPTSSHAPKKTPFPPRLLTSPSGVTKASRPDSKAAAQSPSRPLTTCSVDDYEHTLHDTGRSHGIPATAQGQGWRNSNSMPILLDTTRLLSFAREGNRILDKSRRPRPQAVHLSLSRMHRRHVALCETPRMEVAHGADPFQRLAAKGSHHGLVLRPRTRRSPAI